MKFFGGGAQERPLDPDFAVAKPFEIVVPSTDLTWDLSIPGLTTQYKSFYFTFHDGSAGFIQYSYGNLGILVKVAPIGFSYYTAGKPAIVASHTLRSSNMRLSKDQYSVHIAQHSLTMDSDNRGWRAVIKDDKLEYDLHFRQESEAYAIHDFGRKSPQEQVLQRFVPRLSVQGTTKAHGVSQEVHGSGIYTEAFYTHVKFTDFCNEFTYFRLASEDSSESLSLMQYIPRAGTSSGPRITHGTYVKDSKVVAICFQNESVATGKRIDAESGYDLPTNLQLNWSGQALDGQSFKAGCSVVTGEPSSITDVLSMFPKFFKDIVALFAGLPYVFCWRQPKTVATIDIGGQKREFMGTSTTELTRVHKPTQ